MNLSKNLSYFKQCSLKLDNQIMTRNQIIKHPFKNKTMKKILLLFIGILLFACNKENKKSNLNLKEKNKSKSSYSEFKVYPNGLIYSEHAMKKLSHIVDSLNLKFQSCDLNKRFYSKYQTVGYLVRLDSGNVKQANIDMKNQISIEHFRKKYPSAKITKNVLIIKSKYINRENEEITYFMNLELDKNTGVDIELKDKNVFFKDLQNKWVFEYKKMPEYSEESIDAFYFPNEFKSTELPEKYAKMIGYSNCMIDTTSRIFKANLKENFGREMYELPKNMTSLSLQQQLKLLDKLRSTRVVGACSQDDRPRNHAVKIALLSAETASWKIFLRSHLDIMNDRFDRITDGSYAQAGRKTYIKEIEELNINVPDLLFGILFSVDNPAKNNYYGNVYRIGRALSETKNKQEIEDGLLAIINDPKLDDYNRVAFYYLFLIYNKKIKDEKIHRQNMEKLAFVKFPNYIKYGLRIE